MAVPRFFVHALTGRTIVLSGREAHHAARVRRLGVGDAVEIFDGRGAVALGRITALNGERLEVAIHEQQSDPGSSPALVVAASTPKGNRADWMIEKLAELGCRLFVPLLTARGVVRPSDVKVERWRRKCIEATKQSGAAVAMQVAPPTAVRDLLEVFTDRPSVLAADPQPDLPTFAECLDAAGGRAVVIVGPEGGWTREEREKLQSGGARMVRLTPTILRVETAALAMAAAWALRAIRR